MESEGAGTVLKRGRREREREREQGLCYRGGGERVRESRAEEFWHITVARSPVPTLLWDYSLARHALLPQRPDAGRVCPFSLCVCVCVYVR